LFTSVEQVSGADGASTTILVSENVQATTWHAVSMKGQRSPQAFNIFVFWNVLEDQIGDSRFQSIGINRDRDGLPDGTSLDARLTAARPSSFHSGGVNVAFCDSRVTFLREDIDYSVYGQLMTPDSKRCPSRSHFIVPLNDKDCR
jgi:prepilin-type processing-associated H-X9-DG protein